MDNKLYRKRNYGEYILSDVFETVRASGGDVGGYRNTNHVLYSPTIGALCARDYKGVGNQYVDESKLVIEVSGID